jgi:hypothetical protein
MGMVILAHAFGARYDLPVPLLYFVLGGAAVVVVTFLVVLPTTTTPAPSPTAGDGGYVDPRRPLGAAFGVIGWAFLIGCGLFGSQAIPENILPTLFWLILWIAVPISCAVVGDWTPWLNPLATIARAADRPGLRRALLGGPELGWPGWLSWWPAVFFFFVAASGELIYNLWATRPLVTAVGLLLYAFLTAVGSVIFGAEAWLSRGEVFSVLFSTWGRLGWWRLGRPGPDGFLGGLEQDIEASAGRITFVLLMLMSVTFDGLLATPYWKRLELQLPPDFSVGSIRYIVLAEAAFIALVALAWSVFGLFSLVVRRGGGLGGGVRSVLANLLASLVPIAFGYLVAHNLDYLLVNGQLLIPLVGNPTGRAQWLPAPFNDHYVIHQQPVPPWSIWYLQVGLIVIVHMAAVVIAHRRLARSAPDENRARRSEWPWTTAMVGYTMTSLWLLALPIVKGG